MAEPVIINPRTQSNLTNEKRLEQVAERKKKVLAQARLDAIKEDKDFKAAVANPNTKPEDLATLNANLLKKYTDEELQTSYPSIVGKAAQKVYNDEVLKIREKELERLKYPGGQYSKIPDETYEQKLQRKEASDEALKETAEIEKQRLEYVLRQSKIYVDAGLTPEQARIKASNEYNQTVGPEMLRFGDKSPTGLPAYIEPAAPIGMGDKPAALKPQQYIPSSAQMVEASRIGTSRGGGTEPKWDIINSSLIDAGLTEDDASAHIEGLKQVYQGYLDRKEKPENALKKTLDVLPNIAKKVDAYEKGEPGAAITDPTIVSGQQSVWAPFLPQEKAGKGIPAFDENELKFQKVVNDEKRKKRLDELTKKYSTEPLYVDEIIPSEVKGGKPTTERREVTDPNEKKKVIQKKLDEEIPSIWWQDPQRRANVFSGKGTEDVKGILAVDTAFGGTKETTAGYLLRLTASPWNATIGYLFDPAFTGGITEDSRKTQQRLQKERRERRPEEYKDSPALYNVAEGRGLTGEVIEAADILGIDGALRTAYVGAAFAGDFLDPTFDVVGGALAGTRAAAQAAKASKAVTGEAKLGKAALYGAETAAKSTLENFGFGRYFESGDVRNFITATAVKEGEAARIATKVIEDGGSVADVAQELKKANLSNTGFEKRLKQRLDMQPGTNKDIKFAAKEVNNSFPLGAQISDASKAIDNIAAGRPQSVLRSKELAKELGTLAKSDDAILQALRGVDAARAEGRLSNAEDVISQYVKELAKNDDMLKKLKGRFTLKLATEAVFDATKNIKALDNVVQLTQNTFAGKATAEKILNKVQNSEIGKIIADIRKTKPEISFLPNFKQGTQELISSTANVPAIKLTVEQAKKIAPLIDELITYKALSQDSLIGLQIGLQEGKISLESLRRIIDAEVDLVARASGKATDAANILRLESAQEVNRILEPLETKSFGRDFVYDELQKMSSSITDPIKTDLSPGQKNILQKARQKASNLDKKLQQDMTRLLKDPGFRESFIGTSKDITRQQALAALIVDPKKFSPTTIEEVFRSAINSSIFSKTMKEDAFDKLVGARLFRDLSPFNEQGIKIINDKIKDAIIDIESKILAAQGFKKKFGSLKAPTDEKLIDLINKADNIILNSGDFWNSLDNILKEASMMAENPAFLKNPDAKLTNFYKAAGDKVSKEIQIGAYLRAEAERSIRDSLAELVSNQSKKTNIGYGQVLSPAETAILSKRAGKAGAGKEMDLWQFLITDRLEKNLSGESFRYADNITRDMISAPLKNLYDTNPVEVTRIMSEADDVAQSIAKGSNLKLGSDPKEIKDIISKTFKDPTLANQVEIMFGSDIYKQIKSEIGEGGEKISKAIDDIMEINYNQGNYSQAIRILNNIKDSIEASFYTLVLNASARFHGGNILGAPSILYSTLGKQGLRSLGELDNAALVMARAGSASGNSIAIVDKAGRPYTYNELNDMFGVLGGQSVYGFDTPNSLSNELIRAVSNSEGFLSPNALSVGRVWDAFKDLPNKSDKLFRNAVGIQALKDGRTVDEAIALSRASMYDAGAIGQTGIESVDAAEKLIKRLTLFYGFTRNSLVNTLKNITSPEGLNRIIKTERFRKNLEYVLADDQEKKDFDEISKFRPESAQARSIIDVFSKGDEGYVATLAPDATLSAITTLTKIAEGQIGDVVGGMLRPEFKTLFGVEDDRKQKRIVDPETIAILDLVGQVDNESGIKDGLLNNIFFAGEKIQAVPSKSSKAKDGVVYVMSPKAAERYETVMMALGIIGLTRIMNEYPRMLSAEGTPTSDFTALQRAGYASGIYTPIKAASAEKTRLYNLLSEKEKGKELLKELDKLEKDLPPITTITKAQIKARSASIKEKEEDIEEKATETELERTEAIQEKQERKLEKASEEGEISSKEEAIRLKKTVKPQKAIKIEKPVEEVEAQPEAEPKTELRKPRRSFLNKP